MFGNMNNRDDEKRCDRIFYAEIIKQQNSHNFFKNWKDNIIKNKVKPKYRNATPRHRNKLPLGQRIKLFLL